MDQTYKNAFSGITNLRRAIINNISLNETPLGPSDNAASYNHTLTSPSLSCD